MKASDIKYIKIKNAKKNRALMRISLQDFVLKMTNAGLISLALSRHVAKFVKDLELIPLSEEFQKYD